MFRSVCERAVAIMVGMFGSSIFTIGVMTGALEQVMGPVPLIEFVVGGACMVACAWVVLDDRYGD